MLLKNIQKFIYENKDDLKAKGLKIHDDHALPTSRRDLLAMGFYTAGYTVVLPSLGSVLLNAKEAQAATCVERPLPAGVPFFQIHASGGWITRDVIHGLKGNGRDGDYTKPEGGYSTDDYYEWGIAKDWHPAVKAPFMLGGHPVPQTSAAYLAAVDYYGTEDLTSTPLNGKFHLFSFNHRSPDDTRSSLQNYLASAAVLRGNGGDFPIVSTGDGTNLTGVNALPSFSIVQKTNVVRGNDISSLVNTGDLPAEVRPAFIQSVSAAIRDRLSNAELQSIMGCSADSAVKLVKSYSEALDPSAGYPALQAAIPANNASLRSVVGMMFSGICSVGGMSLGGYDYHGDTAQNQQDDNFALWRNSVFPIVDAAIKENKNMIIAITSDGAVRCSVSEMAVTTTVNINGQATNFNFVMPQGVGDFGRNGSTLLIAIGAVPADAIKYHQIGHALAGGGVARDGNLIGYDQVASSSAVLETARRLMNILNPANKLKKTFQDATGGARVTASLEPFIAVKDVG